jgi:hypothetical protein
MKRMIVSGYVGDEWKEVVDATWPSVESYAIRWGCVFHGCEMPRTKRHPPWSKLICIADAFSSADEVLWVDGDVMVADGSESIFERVPPSADHAACFLTDRNGEEHYNTGVWLLRKSMMPHLVSAAMDDDCVHHPWWEQMAINNIVRAGLVETHPLGEEWNFWEGSPPDIHPRFRHSCGIRDRAARLSFLKGGSE